jgi:hypothetical protein
MSIIYDPLPNLFNFRHAAEGGLVGAALLGAADFVAGENKDWAYYAGAAVGYGAVATGWGGAVLTFYVAAEVAQLTFLKSPEGAQFTVFVDGVEYAIVSSYLGTSVWDTLVISGLANTARKIDIVHNGAATESALSWGWLALGEMTLSGGARQLNNSGEFNMAATNIVSMTIRDYKGKRSTVAVHFPTTFTIAQLQAWLDTFAVNLDGVTEGAIESANVTVGLTVPGAVKLTPLDDCDIEEGGNFSFSTPGRYRHTIRVPAISQALVSGNSVNHAVPPVSTMLQNITAGVDVSGTLVIPTNGHGEDLVSLSAATKTFRRK